MSASNVEIRFEDVSFEYGHTKPILDTVDFSVRKGAKVALMGQNGAGKSTLFQLITGEIEPESGDIHIDSDQTIATGRQIIPREEYDLTIREFFEKGFSKLAFEKASGGKDKIYDIDKRIDSVLEVVNLTAPHDRLVRSFSGGQQARLLLASALIQDPDILLLDEPTNNLDAAGIEHLTKFLIEYPKTVIVISHDAGFLNAFTEGVLYLDVFTKKVEQYNGNYFDVVKQITARIEKENMKNAQLAKEIQANKDKANFFSQKGGKMRLVAKKMRTRAEEAEEELVDVRQEDKTIRPFVIPVQKDPPIEILKMTSFTTMRKHKPVAHKRALTLKRNKHLLLQGPNGIGKSTLLEAIARGTAGGIQVSPGVKVGYYRQDFSTLNFEDTVYQSLNKASSNEHSEEKMRSIAAGFLITADMINTKIGALSEGQKGLVAFAQLVLERPGLLILDEPTNHINFRHIPIIAEALDKYEGAMILVSHVPSFVKKIRIDEVLDLEK